MLLSFRPRHTTESRYGSLALVERLFIAPPYKGINSQLSCGPLGDPTATKASVATLPARESPWDSERLPLPRARTRQRIHRSIGKVDRHVAGCEPVMVRPSHSSPLSRRSRYRLPRRTIWVIYSPAHCLSWSIIPFMDHSGLKWQLVHTVLSGFRSGMPLSHFLLKARWPGPEQRTYLRLLHKGADSNDCIKRMSKRQAIEYPLPWLGGRT